MDKTEKKTAEEMFLDIADQVVPDGTYLSSKDEVAVYRAMHEYAAQELAEYKARLKEAVKTEPSDDLWTIEEIIQLIDIIR